VAGAGAKAVPGAVLIFAGQRPAQRLLPVGSGALELGRIELSGADELDAELSRRHVRLSFAAGECCVRDLDSRNGTYLNGVRIRGETRVTPGSTLRVGGAVLLITADLTPFEQYGVGISHNVVGGPALRATFGVISGLRLAQLSSLLVTGETGSGKELAARAFHGSGSREPFTAVNCATIPKDLAERLLFGSRRGAFSGATDAPGYAQMADGGTLFLDEIAELPLDVQSKLLRMLETREVLRLGATSPEQVELRVCAATWRDLRSEAALGRFRADLYFRIGQPEIHLPPLRERREEVPWHIQQVLDASAGERPVRATSAFVEACALRAWPGNVRELRGEARRAAVTAVAAGRDLLLEDDLGPTAGRPLSPEQTPPSSRRFPDDQFAAALTVTQGNVVEAARNLGVHRNTVRRWLERHQVEAARFKPARK